MKRVARAAGPAALVTALVAGTVLGAVSAPAGATGRPVASRAVAAKPAVLTAALHHANGTLPTGRAQVLSTTGTHAAATGHLVRFTLVTGDRSRPVTGTKVPATFTHTWKRAGTYHLAFSVVDSRGVTATVRTTLTFAAPRIGGGGATAGTFGGGGAASTGTTTAAVVCAAPKPHPAAGTSNGSQFTGTVRGPDGRPLAGVPVTLREAGGVLGVPYQTLLSGIVLPVANVPLSSVLTIPGSLTIPYISNTVATDASGRFSLDALPLDWVPNLQIPALDLPILGPFGGQLRSAILGLLRPDVVVNGGDATHPADLNYSVISADTYGGTAVRPTLPAEEDVTLQAAGSVSGRVASGAAGEQVTVDLGPRPAGAESGFLSTTTAADGSFLLGQVPLGTASVYGAGAGSTVVTLTACQPDVAGVLAAG